MLQPSSYGLPDIITLKDTVKAFKESLQVNYDEARKIEAKTREQRLSSSWFEVRQYRLTASRFGKIISRKADTPPQRLVLSILQPTDFTSEAMRYGIAYEKVGPTEGWETCCTTRLSFTSIVRMESHKQGQLQKC